MPVIKSAKKKLRQDKKRQVANKKVKDGYKALVKQTRANPTIDAVQKTFSSIDKAAKKGIIHPNKAARLKSSVSKLVSSPKQKPTDQPQKKAISPKKKKSTKK